MSRAKWLINNRKTETELNKKQFWIEQKKAADERTESQKSKTIREIVKRSENWLKTIVQFACENLCRVMSKIKTIFKI